jgi:hypothetical protein
MVHLLRAGPHRKCVSLPSTDRLLYTWLIRRTEEYMHQITVIEPKWLSEVAPTFFRVADQNRISKRKANEKIEPLYDRFAADKDDWVCAFKVSGACADYRSVSASRIIPCALPRLSGKEPRIGEDIVVCSMNVRTTGSEASCVPPTAILQDSQRRR